MNVTLKRSLQRPLKNQPFAILDYWCGLRCPSGGHQRNQPWQHSAKEVITSDRSADFTKRGNGYGAVEGGGALEWGRGPRIFEMFLEPTCPFSNKAFGKIKELLSAAGEANMDGQGPAAIPAVASKFRCDRSGDPCSFDTGKRPGRRVARHGSRGRTSRTSSRLLEHTYRPPTAPPLQTTSLRGSSDTAASSWPRPSTFPIPGHRRSKCIAGTQGKMELTSARHS